VLHSVRLSVGFVRSQLLIFSKEESRRNF